MKNVLLSADGEISAFSVPDEAAEHLEQYCQEFCCNWLYESPDAEKYRVKMSGTVGVCYNEKDFIDYLNQYVFDEPSVLVETFAGVYDARKVPEEYIGLPCFYF